MRILYYGAGWPTNIGNAFIDIGAMACIKKACPEAKIAFSSEMPRWFFHKWGQELQFSHKWLERFQRKAGTSKRVNAVIDNALDIAQVVKCDLCIFSGMAMCDEFIQINGKTIIQIAKKGIPIVLLGTGALSYTEEEKKRYAEFLSEIRPVGFISRDDDSYENFAKIVPIAYRGIDCAFFLPEGYEPFKLDIEPFNVVTFDMLDEPDINHAEKRVIRAHHMCWGEILPKYVEHENTLISDIPYDYLTLYANADETHSDRVHACIAALSYGRKAKLYHQTPRGSLFSAVGARNIREDITMPDTAKIDQLKTRQIFNLCEIINSI